MEKQLDYSKRKLVICIDIDGVLRDWIGSVERVMLATFPYLKKSDIRPVTTWDIEDAYPTIKKEIVTKVLFDSHREDVYKWAKAFDGAAEQFEEIVKFVAMIGGRICILTSQPNPAIAQLTMNWLMDDFFTPFLKRSKIEFFIVKGDKTIVDGDILIDDGIHNLDAWVEKGRMAICLNQTWNQEWKGLRVNTLGESLPLIKQTYGTVL